MRTYARVSSALLGLVVVPLLAGALAAACGDDPVGVDACRLMEAARCEETTACKASEADAQYCVSFYRDQCLHGMANIHAELSADATSACVAAIHATGDCARTGAMLMSQCPSIPLIAGKDPATVLPCAIIKRTPQLLSACSFLTAPVDDTSGSSSGSTSSSSSSSGTVDDGGVNDAASD